MAAAVANGYSNGVDAPIKALFNYTRDTDPKLTELYFYDTPDSKDIHEPGDDPHTLPVFNGFDVPEPFTIDKNGFSLEDLTTNYNDWEDDDAVREKFYPEVVEFLKRRTGANRVLIFDHTIRSATNTQKPLTDEKATSQRAPVMLVHCDYTNESAPTRVKQLLPDEAEQLLKGRVAFINVWKPIRHPVEERPLAMCDVASAPSSDFFKLHLRYRDRNGENYVMRHSDRHKWFYFPKIDTNKVILLKTYDSKPDVARFVGHSAFEDPSSPPNARMRESVEIRTIAFWDN